MQLAIDTSTEMASLALLEGSEMLAEVTWRCGQNHTVELLSYLTFLLEQKGINLRSVDCVVVAIGPGSFNGLRAGVSTAKGLALSLGIPIIGVGTLEAAAYQHAEAGLPVCAVSNAGRGEIATATYQVKGGGWSRLIEEHLTTVEALCSQIATGTVFCGEYVPHIAARLKRGLGRKAVIPPSVALFRRAGFIAELGQRRMKAGGYDNPATLQPLYLRRPPITEPKRSIQLERG